MEAEMVNVVPELVSFSLLLCFSCVSFADFSRDLRFLIGVFKG